MPGRIDRAGKRFGTWTVSEKFRTNPGGVSTEWWSRCDCGTERWIKSYAFTRWHDGGRRLRCGGCVSAAQEARAAQRRLCECGCGTEISAYRKNGRGGAATTSKRFVEKHGSGHWSAEQVETLRRLRGTMSAKDLAKVVGHTEWATRIQLNRQGLTVPDGGEDLVLTTIARAAKKHRVGEERMKSLLDAAGVPSGKRTSPDGDAYLLRLRVEDVERAVKEHGGT